MHAPMHASPFCGAAAMTLRSSSSHEEGVIRDWSINTKHLSGDAEGNVRKLHGVLSTNAGYQHHLELDGPHPPVCLRVTKPVERHNRELASSRPRSTLTAASRTPRSRDPW